MHRPRLNRNIGAQRLRCEEREEALAKRLVLRSVHERQVVGPQDPFSAWVDGLQMIDHV